MGYVLYAAIYTTDMAKVLRVSGKIEAKPISIKKGFQFDMSSDLEGVNQVGLGGE